MLSFSCPDGRAGQGYLSRAGGAPAAGIVVIQEWWGLQGQIKSVCDRLAASGFLALAPDLFGGKVVPYHDSSAAKAAMASLDFKAAAEGVVRGAVQHLRAAGPRVGMAGFCMGGAVTIVGAVRIPELDAAVSFYGLPPEDVAAPKDVRVPLQCHFATIDSWCTPEKVDAFEQQLRAAGKTFELFRYPGRHAFMNSERRDAYDPVAAQLAWDRFLAFLRRYLSGSEPAAPA